MLLAATGLFQQLTQLLLSAAVAVETVLAVTARPVVVVEVAPSQGVRL
jgi:hypothetical protein